MVGRGHRWVCAAVVAGSLVGAAAAADAFTATPATGDVIGKMRAEARTLAAVRVRRTGAVVYCPHGPEGWTYAPEAGCSLRATVSEEDDLSRGRVTRIIGRVTAPGRPALTYVVDASGWYRSAGGSRCWTLELTGFTAAPLIDYPLPAEHVVVLSKTRRRIVLRADSRPDAYEELDFVNPVTFFSYRSIEITRARGKSYRINDTATPLKAGTARPLTAPACRTP